MCGGGSIRGTKSVLRISNRKHAKCKVKEWPQHNLSFADLNASSFSDEPFPAFSSREECTKIYATNVGEFG